MNLQRHQVALQCYLALLVAPNYQPDNFAQCARMAYDAADAFSNETRRQQQIEQEDDRQHGKALR